jgi:hypothetical protein
MAQVGHTLANLARSITGAPLGGAFEPQAWAKPAA